MKVYQELTNVACSIKKCEQECKLDIANRQKESLKKLEKKYLPKGSGFDDGSTVDYFQTTERELLIETGYHHMSNGMYIGWSYYRITVIPNLITEIELKVELDHENPSVTEARKHEYGDIPGDDIDFVGQRFSEALRSKVT